MNCKIQHYVFHEEKFEICTFFPSKMHSVLIEESLTPYNFSFADHVVPR